MRMVHVIPHAPFPGPEGHNSRHEALLSVMPGLTLAWPQSPGFLGQWDLALVESGAPVPKAERVVAIVKATNQPTAPIPADLTIPTGPYEGLPGSVGPLIRIAPEHERDIDLLLVPSVGQNNHWFFGLPGIPGGWEMMSRASVVICAGGNGSLYEAL